MARAFDEAQAGEEVGTLRIHDSSDGRPAKIPRVCVGYARFTGALHSVVEVIKFWPERELLPYKGAKHRVDALWLLERGAII